MLANTCTICSAIPSFVERRAERVQQEAKPYRWHLPSRRRLLHLPPVTDSDTTAVDSAEGLTATQVAERVADGRVNTVPVSPRRSVRQIIRANVVTPVNMIMTTLLVLILVSGHPADALFAGVIISNSVIGIIQEIRAKRTLDELEVLNASRTTVRRDGEDTQLDVSDVVANDLMLVGPGDQIVVDGTVIESIGLDIDESLLTGESDAVTKEPGDEVLSGSFVSSGSGSFTATKIGGDSYAASLTEEARRFVLVNSELRNGVNLILRWLTFIIPPVSILLFWQLLDAEDRWQEALQGTVAAAVAMVPDGLVLLTSITFIVGILALARRQALAKELASVELLARVDVLCLDKTGTITTGEISFESVEPINGAIVEDALAAMAVSDPNPNPTLAAIATRYPAAPGWVVTDSLPFSSVRKWSSTSFQGHGTWFLGAPEILAPNDEFVRQRVAEHAEQGRRVVLAARAPTAPVDKQLPDGIEALGLVLLEDTVREDAPEILRYLADQGISLRVISGDHPGTVAAVARRAGVPDVVSGLDARNLPSDEAELADILERHVVYGRVTPHQKRAMVKALQSNDHVVAMTGDGVNDVLALKDADMGIAMGSGSAATRSVAQITLLDNRFSTLPIVLAEGRRVMNNIERVANLFVAKATYAVLLATATGIAGVPFPFLPRHLTLIGSFSIGLPGFFLALSPNVKRAVPGFVARVLRLAVPGGAIAAVVTFIVYEIVRRDELSSQVEERTAATLTLLGLGLAILGVVARPMNRARVVLIVAMAAAYAVIMVVPFCRDYFVLDSPRATHWWTLITAVAIGSAALIGLAKWLDHSAATRDGT